MKRKKAKSDPVVAVIMGSDSDYKVMKGAVDALKEFRVPHTVKIISAHRTPNEMVQFATTAYQTGLRVIIAGAGGAAHLPGMVASLTELPVIGVPVELQSLKGVDSLLSIVQMPKGVPVATVAINGGYNAGLLACKILAIGESLFCKELACELAGHRETLRKNVLRKKIPKS